MAKRKNSPALFEVISRSRESQSQSGLRVPTWMGGEADEQQSDQQPAPEAAQQQAPPKQVAQPEPSRTRAKTYEPQHEQAFSTAEGRLRVSLNYSTAIVLGVAVVLLLAAAFAIGRATAGSGGAEAATAGQSGTGGTEQKQQIADPRGPVIQREPGKHYLVIWDADANAGLDSQANRIAAFFTDEGEQAEVYTLKDSQSGGEFLAVWSAAGFDRRDSQAAENYKRKIQQLGQKYRQEHGNVRFSPWYAEFQPQQ